MERTDTLFPNICWSFTALGDDEDIDLEKHIFTF